MPFTVQCAACSSRFALSDTVYDERIAGRVVELTCKHCKKSIRVDGTRPRSEQPKKPQSTPRTNGGVAVMASRRIEAGGVVTATEVTKPDADLPSVKPASRAAGGSGPLRAAAQKDAEVELPRVASKHRADDADLPSVSNSHKAQVESDLPSVKPRGSSLRAPTRADLHGTSRAPEDNDSDAKVVDSKKSAIRVPLPQLGQSTSTSRPMPAINLDAGIPIGRTKLVAAASVTPTRAAGASSVGGALDNSQPSPKNNTTSRPATARVSEPVQAVAHESEPPEIDLVEDAEPETRVFQRPPAVPARGPGRPPPRRNPGLKATMMGVAPPGNLRATPGVAATEAPVAAPRPAPVASAIRGEPVASFAKTALGTGPAPAGRKKLGGGTMLGLAPPPGPSAIEATSAADAARSQLELASTSSPDDEFGFDEQEVEVSSSAEQARPTLNDDQPALVDAAAHHGGESFAADASIHSEPTVVGTPPELATEAAQAAVSALGLVGVMTPADGMRAVDGDTDSGMSEVNIPAEQTASAPSEPGAMMRQVAPADSPPSAVHEWDAPTSDVSNRMAHSMPAPMPKPSRRRGRWLLASLVLAVAGVSAAGVLVYRGHLPLPAAIAPHVAAFFPQARHAAASVGARGEAPNNASPEHAAAEAPTAAATDEQREVSASDEPTAPPTAQASAEPGAAVEDDTDTAVPSGAAPEAEAEASTQVEGSTAPSAVEPESPGAEAAAPEAEGAAPSAAVEVQPEPAEASAQPASAMNDAIPAAAYGELPPRKTGLAQAMGELPPGVNMAGVQYKTGLAMKRAEKCHLGGRATGDATVVISFGPDGRPTSVIVRGEPIASAPVASCLVLFGKSVVIPRFESGSLTIAYPITLR